MSNKFFQVIPRNVRFQIIGFRGKFLTISGFAFTASLILLIVRGLNFGIDFSGGTEVQIEFTKQVPDSKLANIRADISKALPGVKSEVQGFGTDRGYLLKFGKVSFLSEKQANALKAGVQKAFPAPKGSNRPFALLGFRFRTEGGDKVDVRFQNKLTGLEKKKKKASTSKPTSKPSTQAASKPSNKKVALKGTDLEKLQNVFKANGIPSIDVEGPISQTNGFEYTISFAGLSAKIKEVMGGLYGPKNFKIMRVESVGPRVGKRLRNDGILALLLANIFILIYIAIRFDFRYAPGAVAALVHDIVITAGVFSAFWLPFDLSIIAALLTIVGYSLNDTIVVYDRIRENWQKSNFDFGGVMNRSINETLSRTLLTSITTFLAVVPIYMIGGSNIRWFAFAMMFGILIGTYSSIAIASPIVYYLNNFFSRKQTAEEEAVAQKREQRRRRRKGLA